MTAPATQLTPAPVPEASKPATPDPGDKYLWPQPEDFPNVHELVIENGKPVDNIFSEKQMRLLTEPLHSCWQGPGGGQPFVAMANVGVFFSGSQPPIVPDALVAVGVLQGDLAQRENRSYFVWLRGKTPDVAVEIVSNREGGEDTDKLLAYARMPIPYYVIYDPENYLRQGPLRVYQLVGRTYRLLAPPYFFEEVGLGVQLWTGRYEDFEGTWLRWCDRDARLIPTGAERAAKAELQTEEERQRAAKAEQQSQHDQRELQQARQELERLKEKLRAAGMEPSA